MNENRINEVNGKLAQRTSHLRVDGECERTGHRLLRDPDEKAARRQSPPASRKAGQVDQRRNRLVGMGDPEMYDRVAIRCRTSRTDYTSRRSASACSQRPA